MSFKGSENEGWDIDVSKTKIKWQVSNTPNTIGNFVERLFDIFAKILIFNSQFDFFHFLKKIFCIFSMWVRARSFASLHAREWLWKGKGGGSALSFWLTDCLTAWRQAPLDCLTQAASVRAELRELTLRCRDPKLKNERVKRPLINKQGNVQANGDTRSSCGRRSRMCSIACPWLLSSITKWEKPIDEH